MNLIKQILILSLCLFFINGFSQKILVVEKISAKVKSLKYKTGDKIIFNSGNKGRTQGYINNIEDSVLTINNKPTLLKEINIIYTERALFLVLSSIGIMGGGAFIVIDGFNNIINNESPILKTETLKAGGIMLGAGILFNAFIYKKRKVDKDEWRLKVFKYYNL